MTKIQGDLKALLARVTRVPADELGLDRDLLMEGVLDSLQVVRLAEELEESFGIQLDPFDLSPENFACLRSLVDLVAAKLGRTVSEAVPGSETIHDGAREKRRRAI